MVATLWLWTVDSLLEDSDEAFFCLSLSSMHPAREVEGVLEYRSGYSVIVVPCQR